jgi:hypothetical protein
VTTAAALPEIHTPIAGCAPSSISESTIMTVWPSNAAYGIGRVLGTQYAMRFPDIYIFRIGNLIALLSIPVALAIYLYRIAPFVGQRYTVTNRRVVVQRGIQAKDDRSVDLDRFDSVQVEVLPGQAWYNAGDLVFKLGNVETFRLDGVSRPESFRQVILKARMAHAGVKKSGSR